MVMGKRFCTARWDALTARPAALRAHIAARRSPARQRSAVPAPLPGRDDEIGEIGIQVAAVGQTRLGLEVERDFQIIILDLELGKAGQGLERARDADGRLLHPIKPQQRRAQGRH